MKLAILGAGAWGTALAINFSCLSPSYAMDAKHGSEG